MVDGLLPEQRTDNDNIEKLKSLVRIIFGGLFGDRSNIKSYIFVYF